MVDTPAHQHDVESDAGCKDHSLAVADSDAHQLSGAAEGGPTAALTEAQQERMQQQQQQQGHTTGGSQGSQLEAF